MSHRIVLADDHKIIRDGLRSLLEQNVGFKVVAEADNGRAAVELARDLRPDLVIMDIGMPDLNGIEATRQIVADCPRTKVLALSMHARAQFVGRMLEAGASGYLLKDSAFEELVEAIRTVLANRAYLSKEITGVVIDDYIQRRADQRDTVDVTLTPREREILQLLAEGRSTKETAAELHVSIKTVETHRQHIMDKLGIHNIAGLTKFAIQEGLTELDN
ncbi:MAG: DNA-binding response regulator [Planctomycetaceae bacterium]|nr:DNA-binding response regulator [Planctomycetaceae bacterium]